MKREAEYKRTDTGLRWIIRRYNAELTEEDKDFIRAYNPAIYFNDETSKYWCFDTRLPSGLWLENISPRADFETIYAEVYGKL